MAMNSSTAAALPLAHASSKNLRTRVLFFSSASDTGAYSSSLPPAFLQRVDTMSMMLPGGLRHIGWRLIHKVRGSRTSLFQILRSSPHTPGRFKVFPAPMLTSFMSHLWGMQLKQHTIPCGCVNSLFTGGVYRSTVRVDQGIGYALTRGA